MCQYAFYKNGENKLYCNINNQMCLYSKFCSKQQKYIHREGAENCYMAIEEQNRHIPDGAYYVRFVLKGYAYVEIGNSVKMIKDTIGNIKNYVYLRDNNGEYEMSLTPFTMTESNEEKPKRQYNRKKK